MTSPKILTVKMLSQLVGRSVDALKRDLRRKPCPIPGAEKPGREWLIPNTPEAIAAAAEAPPRGAPPKKRVDGPP
jgi:hypothetical protein